MNCLIICHGYFGDHLFATSIAKKLIEEKQFDEVDYVVGWPQVIPFFKRNPYIHDVILGTNAGPSPVLNRDQLRRYDKVFQLGPVNRMVTPPEEMQLLCGVQNPSPEFTIYTHPDSDAEFKAGVDLVREQHGPVVAIMNNWQPKAFLFTKEQYEKGIDVPYKGYGGQLRNIPMIVSGLEERYPTVLVGAPANVNQFQTNYTGRSLDQEASLIKACDYFVGAEGGLANIAAGVGTPTIITSDFIAQLYGPNGLFQKLPNPKLGPHFYFPNGNHSFLNPFISDDEVVDIIQTILKNGSSIIYDWESNSGGDLCSFTK